MTTAIKHHPKVNADKGWGISPIKCTSRKEMEETFLDIAVHYGAKVNDQECFVIPVIETRNAKIRHTPWNVFKLVFLSRGEEHYRVGFNQVGSYSAGEAISASYPDGGWPVA